MTRRRDPGQRQRRLLDSLGLARRRTPGPAAGALVSDTLPALAVLAALEHAADLARLARMAADPADDTQYRRLVVILTTAAGALRDDLRSGTTAETTRLYDAITTTMQKEDR